MGTSSVALLGTLSFIIWIVIAAAGASILGVAYNRTRMLSFLWLLGAVVVWPTIGRLTSFAFSMAAPHIAAGASMPMSSISMIFVGITLAETLVGGILLIVALAILSRECVARLAPKASPGVPGYSAPPYMGPGSAFRG
jgi:hypothetical protein